MAGPAAQKRGGEEVAREAVAQPPPVAVQPSPFAQRGGAGEVLTVAARFDAAAQSVLDHKSSMLEAELSGPISREDTQHHRRRMNEEQQRAEASGNKELYDRAHMSWALMAGADRVETDCAPALGASAAGDTTPAGAGLGSRGNAASAGRSPALGSSRSAIRTIIWLAAAIDARTMKARANFTVRRKPGESQK